MRLIIATAMAGLLSTAASAATLDFSGDICIGGTACANGDAIDQSYGDMLGVDLMYDGDASTTAIEDVFVWGTGYEDFSDAIYTDLGTEMSLSLLAETGYEVTLTSLAIAPYLNRINDTQVRILDLATSTNIVNRMFAPLSTDGSTTITANATSSVGFSIFFGPDAYDVGIGSLSYDAQLVGQPAAVPLPAAGWMLVAGMGGLFAAKRKRR
jgi:hypothetical protein